jgi:hypothetical protein
VTGGIPAKSVGVGIADRENAVTGRDAPEIAAKSFVPPAAES